MKIINNITPPGHSLALALGFFDGLHRGHTSVISSAAAQKANGLLPAVFTFKESPQAAIAKKSVPRLITPEERAALLEQMGIELLYEIAFSDVRNMTAREFVDKLIYERLGAKKVFCGFNYRFGKSGAGDEKTLHSLCIARGIESFTSPPVSFGGLPISSTRIRQSLEHGDIKSANAMLGRRFSFCFKVAHGNALGRKMETPTINQPIPPDFILPKFGVYATLATVGGKTRRAVTNIGVKPTVGSESPLAETWILDADVGSVYGASPKIELVEFIRPEKRFSGIDELQSAILNDGKTAENIFKTLDILL